MKNVFLSLFNILLQSQLNFKFRFLHVFAQIEKLLN